MKIKFSFLEPAYETHTALLYFLLISRTGKISNALAPKVTPRLNFGSEPTAAPQHLPREPPPAKGQGSARARLGAVRGTSTGAGRAGRDVRHACREPPSPGRGSLTVSAAAPRGGQPVPAAAERSAATRRPSSASPWWPCPLRPRRRHRPALRPALSRASAGSECCPAAAGGASELAPGALPALPRARARHSRDEWGGRRSGPRVPTLRPSAILDPSRLPRARPAPRVAPPPGTGLRPDARRRMRPWHARPGVTRAFT